MPDPYSLSLALAFSFPLLLAVFLRFLRAEALAGGGGSLDPVGDGFADLARPVDSIRRLMGKGGSVPKPNKRQEMLNERLIRAQIRQAEQKVEMPEIPPPLPIESAPPPPSTSTADTLEAEQLEKRKALKRTNARRNTVFAGETGGLGGGADTLG